MYSRFNPGSGRGLPGFAAISCRERLPPGVCRDVIFCYSAGNLLVMFTANSFNRYPLAADYKFDLTNYCTNQVDLDTKRFISSYVYIGVVR